MDDLNAFDGEALWDKVLSDLEIQLQDYNVLTTPTTITQQQQQQQQQQQPELHLQSSPWSPPPIQPIFKDEATGAEICHHVGDQIFRLTPLYGRLEDLKSIDPVQGYIARYEYYKQRHLYIILSPHNTLQQPTALPGDQQLPDPLPITDQSLSVSTAPLSVPFSVVTTSPTAEVAGPSTSALPSSSKNTVTAAPADSGDQHLVPPAKRIRLANAESVDWLYQTFTDKRDDRTFRSYSQYRDAYSIFVRKGSNNPFMAFYRLHKKSNVQFVIARHKNTRCNELVVGMDILEKIVEWTNTPAFAKYRQKTVSASTANAHPETLSWCIIDTTSNTQAAFVHENRTTTASDDSAMSVRIRSGDTIKNCVDIKSDELEFVKQCQEHFSVIKNQLL
ncbi:uncharacterized protein LOC129602155 [Paramacrobiotus metropolitanus]|uniref:uncharacterized protein LOC129602155 n=1 Tax=Paramacrobiotus metropolitanus TaxID=2943436 RepID=UPI00244642AE|nr:uncharacterized protein LOC129602155 [Paramacrobiotus metropolitanus]